MHFSVIKQFSAILSGHFNPHDPFDCVRQAIQLKGASVATTLARVRERTQQYLSHLSQPATRWPFCFRIPAKTALLAASILPEIALCPTQAFIKISAKLAYGTLATLQLALLLLKQTLTAALGRTYNAVVYWPLTLLFQVKPLPHYRHDLFAEIFQKLPYSLTYTLSCLARLPLQEALCEYNFLLTLHAEKAQIRIAAHLGKRLTGETASAALQRDNYTWILRHFNRYALLKTLLCEFQPSTQAQEELQQYFLKRAYFSDSTCSAEEQHRLQTLSSKQPQMQITVTPPQ